MAMENGKDTQHNPLISHSNFAVVERQMSRSFSSFFLLPLGIGLKLQHIASQVVLVVSQ